MFPRSNQKGSFFSCKDVRGSFKSLLPTVAAPVLFQFLAKYTQEVLDLSKKFLGLGKICWEIKDVMQNYRFSSISNIIISMLLWYLLLWELSTSHGKQWSISNSTRIYLEVGCVFKNSLVEFYTDGAFLNIYHTSTKSKVNKKTLFSKYHQSLFIYTLMHVCNFTELAHTRKLIWVYSLISSCLLVILFVIGSKIPSTSLFN